MKKILIDLGKYYKTKNFSTECSYFYHQLTANDATKNWGVEKLLAKAAQFVICRQCKRADCIIACPNESLEKNKEGILQRYSMRCTSCKSCSVACPFGTIYLDILSYKTSQCDYCIDRSNGKPPKCVETDKTGILSWIEAEEDELTRLQTVGQENIYKISDKLLAYSLKWR